MIERLLGACIAAFLVVVGAPNATAQNSDWDVCNKSSGDAAIDGCTRAIGRGRYQGSALAILYYNRGCEFNDKKNYERAIEDYNRAIQLNPQADYYNNRGVSFVKNGDEDRAFVDFEAALGIDPNHAKAHKNRADIYAARKQYDRALSDYDEAIRLDPNYKGAIEKREQVRELKQRS